VLLRVGVLLVRHGFFEFKAGGCGSPPGSISLVGEGLEGSVSFLVVKVEISSSRTRRLQG
jgi:hypothetical protein